MSAPNAMTGCPDNETLAAFIDGRLDPHASRAVIEHMADCPDCRDIFVAEGDLRADADVAPETEPEVSRFRARSWAVPLAVAATLAIALSLTVFRDRLFGPGTSDLVEASRSLKFRPVAARTSLDFPYKPPRPVLRNVAPKEIESDEVFLVAVAAQIKERVDLRSARSLHEVGTAYLVTRDHSEAVEMLEEAARNKSGESSVDAAIVKLTDVDLLSDLAAAYIARGQTADVAAAVKAAERAWTLEKTPTTAWNRALALERADRLADSAAAWRTYLRMDPSSEWSTEAQRHLDDVTSPDY
ncbi:MAG TPA: zf-HC2 domain-containing protein [Thermoanaerobaculia bacterium]|nr:zf-HC2 domain-containing protein [Thermoanaerobaculia bacterium]